MERPRLAAGLCIAGITALALAIPAAAAVENEDVIQDVLEILKDRGIVDEGEYGELVSKNTAYQEEAEGKFLNRIEWSGDFRFRYEHFWINKDAFNPTDGERGRMRYRFRLKGKAYVNEYADVIFRLASGEGGARSTNRTIGRLPDFAANPIFLDQAYLVLHQPMPDGGFLAGSKVDWTLGKVKNPFVWKNGKDLINWDQDINPEGIGIVFNHAPNEDFSIFANTGLFIIKENSSATDPKVFGIQGGFEHTPSEAIRWGARASWYSFSSLDPAFYGRSASNGSIIDGLGERVRPFEVAGYMGFDHFEKWPILAYAYFVMNPDADASKLFLGAGKENIAYAIGIEGGDKRELVKLGVGWWHIQANSWPAQFTDSDILDGVTNRQGLLLYATRALASNMDIAANLFWSSPIQEQVNLFPESIDGGDRFRLQLDLKVKF